MIEVLRRGTSRGRERRYNQASGFTIVELIIVIIVIAILALIVITTYNGVQQKARNTKSIAAVAAWAKALHLYNVDTDSWPASVGSCLGDTTTYDGDGHCWNGGFVVDASFVTAVRPYLGSGPVPEPDTTDVNPSGTEYRGAFYYVDPSWGPEIRFMLASASSCPKIGGLTPLGTSLTSASGVICTQQLNS